MSANVGSSQLGVARARSQTVYLCGPITGGSLHEITGWRRTVAEALADAAQVIDPTHHSPDTTRRCESVLTRAMTEERLLHGRRTVERDQSDIQRSDVVLACFLGTKSVSIGSVGELFWANAMRKPIVIVREEDNLHNHDMLNAIAGWIFTDLEAGIRQVRRLINSDDSR